MDALVDCGNALSQLAEVSENREGLSSLVHAVEAYQTALAKSQDTMVIL